MIYFVRHGQTINNLEHIFYDQTLGPDLTNEGIVQAEITAKELKDKKFEMFVFARLDLAPFKQWKLLQSITPI